MVPEMFVVSRAGFVNNTDNRLTRMDLTNYAKYGISLCTSQSEGVNYYMVTLTYGKKWTVQMPSGQTVSKVMCAKVREDGTYCYMTETVNGLEPVFSLIDETIRYNEELEKKVELLKVKAEELKELFANRSYDELLRLKFIIEMPQEASEPKNKRQSKSGKKTSQKPNTGLTETKLETLPEPEGEPVGETAQKPLEDVKNTDSISDIDKKIAEAIIQKR
jgi:hypothetical protein